MDDGPTRRCERHLLTFDRSGETTPRASTHAGRHVYFDDTVMMLAASADGDDEGMMALLTRGVDPNCRNADGLTPLHQVECMQNSSLDTSNDFKNNRYFRSCCVKRDDPLQVSLDGREDLALLLLTSGGNVNARDDEWWTPLHAAASAGYPDVARHVLALTH